LARPQLNWPPQYACQRSRDQRAHGGGIDVGVLLTPFGKNAAYVAGVILIVILILIVWAFRQGREIGLWPPKIGLRPDRGKAARLTGGNAGLVPSARNAQSAQVTKVFEVAEAAQVITRIDQLRRSKLALRVLDLGGGTGQNVATYFFNDGHISWTYVDSSPAMLSQMQKHLAGRRLYERLSVHLADINRIHTQLPPRSYDVVLLNLVLSSMPTLPDFARIAGLIALGGRLIVADINPLYTHAFPLYKTTDADGALVGMRMQAVHPLDVVTRAKEAGLQLSEMTEIGSDAISYSFVVSFACLARPGEDHSHRDGEALPA
jgi:SAM-dependent methyltransferase